MERSEPALVPEWLKTSGSLTGGGSSTHHFLLSSSHSDVTSLRQHNRNSDFDTPRLPFFDRSSSSNSRRSPSGNGSAKHAYSSFSRSHRERDRDREKERSSFGDLWHHDCSNPLGSLFPRVENDTLRRSKSMVTRKQGELVQQKASMDLKLGLNNNHYNGNATHFGVSRAGSVGKVVFENDFPSLANDERQGGPDIGRVPSPGLGLHVSNSTLIGEGWRSALVEVPPLPVQRIPVGTPGSGATNTGGSLNMAEALAQGAPSRANTIPLLSVETQRLEELAIKQSRQLIPVTPTMPKTSALNSSDKSKPKLVARNGEMVSAVKNGQQQQQPSPLHLVSQPQCVGNVTSDASKTSRGKFLVLKPVWESGLSTGPRDVSSPPNNAPSRIANSQPSLSVVPPSVAAASSKSQNSPKLSAIEHKSPNPGSTLEKRPSFAQAQSRKDFLNLMRKKSSMNISPVLPNSDPKMTPLTLEKSREEVKEAASAPISPHSTENSSEVRSNGGASGESKRCSDLGEQNIRPDIAVYPDEEEAAFLRSLGWEENAGEDEGLTEEEINAFYQEYMKLRPSLKLCGSVLPKLATVTESHATTVMGRGASEVSSSDSGSQV